MYNIDIRYLKANDYSNILTESVLQYTQNQSYYKI